MTDNHTRRKVLEAAHFLALATQHFGDDDLFAFNMSACLSACRSITFYLQKQYGKVPGFADWYCARQIEMGTDEDLVYLNEARVESIHKRYVPLAATRAVSASLDAYVFDPLRPHDDMLEKSEPSGSKTNPTNTVLSRRFVARPGSDAITFCHAQLSKLTAIVRQCEQRYLADSELPS